PYDASYTMDSLSTCTTSFLQSRGWVNIQN
ncbi:MAG: hypothetical protein RLZZ416_739, partial [Candidatus Parcubacteria bacterium]